MSLQQSPGLPPRALARMRFCSVLGETRCLPGPRGGSVFQAATSRLRSLQSTWWAHTFQASCVRASRGAVLFPGQLTRSLWTGPHGVWVPAGILGSRACCCLRLGVHPRTACGPGGNAHSQCRCCGPFPGLLCVKVGGTLLPPPHSRLCATAVGCWAGWAARKRLWRSGCIFFVTLPLRGAVYSLPRVGAGPIEGSGRNP